ncbi:MAG: PIN domain-containing protein [Ginsengibacter sp.]
MTKLFIDTDIIIDLLSDRKIFSLNAGKIFSYAIEKKAQIFTSSHSIATTYYILSQRMKITNADKLIYNILKYIEIIAVNKTTLEKAFSSRFRDMEDAIQYFSALTHGEIEYIITRNISDFKLSSIPVYSSNEILQLL